MKYDPSKLKPYLLHKRDADNEELYLLCNATTTSQKGSIRKLKSRTLNELKELETYETKPKKVTNQDQKLAVFDSPQFIDDPDELLMSVAVRELNKANPDPRWASILINCKKENISHKSEVIEQLQKLPTKNLIEILKKQSGSNLPSEL